MFERQFDTKMWKGAIQYGNYKNDTWLSVGGLHHPAFQTYLAEVKTRPELFEGFNLYVTGGLLEDWQSWDVDWVLTGPYQPERIKAVMEWITELGFKHLIYPDVHYTVEIFSLYDWQQNRQSHSDWLYQLSNVFIKDGVQKDMSFYEPIDGIFRHWCNYPFQKNIELDKIDYKYQKPIQIFL